MNDERLERAREFWDREYPKSNSNGWKVMVQFTESEIARDWTPVSERLPGKEGSYLFQQVEDDEMFDVIYWFNDTLRSPDFYLEHYVAWQEIQPFQGETK
jgi:hypothetical protein